MTNFIDYKLGDLFSSKRGNSKYTKNYCNNNSGEYEVFTGTTIGVFGKIKTYDFDTEVLTYTTDGYAGNVKLLQGKFNIGGHRAALIPKMKDLHLKYFEYVLPPILKKYKRSNCVPTIIWNIIKDIDIPVPVDKNGKISVKEQEKIAAKYENIYIKKDILMSKRKQLKNTSLEIDLSNYKYKEVFVSEIFNLNESTNNSKFTKKFIRENPGDIPVYGATKLKNEVGYGYVCDNATIKNANGKKSYVKYFRDCLTYNIDGSAGYIFYREGKFSLSEKVRPLIIKEKYRNSLDYEYLKYIAEPIFRRNIRGRKGPNGENEFTKISNTIIKDLLIPIPINENGNFDISLQKEIATMYKNAEQIKEGIIISIDKAIDTSVVM